MARGFLPNTYRCYNFVNKNPVIDKVRTILQDEGMFAKGKRKMLHELSGVAIATFDGWFEGDTRDPRHQTVAATMASIGYEEQFVKAQDLNLDEELVKARRWNERRQRERQAAKGNGKSHGNKSRSKKARAS